MLAAIHRFLVVQGDKDRSQRRWFVVVNDRTTVLGRERVSTGQTSLGKARDCGWFFFFFHWKPWIDGLSSQESNCDSRHSTNVLLVGTTIHRKRRRKLIVVSTPQLCGAAGQPDPTHSQQATIPCHSFGLCKHSRLSRIQWLLCSTQSNFYSYFFY